MAKTLLEQSVDTRHLFPRPPLHHRVRFPIADCLLDNNDNIVIIIILHYNNIIYIISPTPPPYDYYYLNNFYNSI